MQHESNPAGQDPDALPQPLNELLEVAAELDRVAQREEEALSVLQTNGVELGEQQLNYPSEQRAHARRIRQAVSAIVTKLDRSKPEPREGGVTITPVALEDPMAEREIEFRRRVVPVVTKLTPNP